MTEALAFNVVNVVTKWRALRRYLPYSIVTTVLLARIVGWTWSESLAVGLAAICPCGGYSGIPRRAGDWPRDRGISPHGSEPALAALTPGLY